MPPTPSSSSCSARRLGCESVRRFRSPVEVVESWMIWTSLAALAVNGGITLALVRGRNDLNLRSILVHNFGDALSNVAIIIGAIIIGATGIRWIDPLLGLAIRAAQSSGQHRHPARLRAHVLLEGYFRPVHRGRCGSRRPRRRGVLEVHEASTSWCARRRPQRASASAPASPTACAWTNASASSTAI